MNGEVTAKADWVLEISWEVCNKVGGIYTVLMSKAALMREYYDNYLVIGPYFRDKTETSFSEEPVPDFLKPVFSFLSSQGVKAYYGSWLVKGEPKAVLIDYRSLIPRKNDFKSFFWERFRIDSLRSGWDFEEPLIWSWAVGLFLKAFSEQFPDKRIVSHHHEWLAGLSLLWIKAHDVPLRTVFTTHATMLGRAIAGSGLDLYSMLDDMDPGAEAYRLGVQDKFLTERACAHRADVFTTVSEITAIEAKKILGIEPAVLLLNGLDLARFPTIEETSIKHVTNRERLREFQTYYFFPYYHNFELEHNIMFAILGRYEFRNKGFDVFIKALGRLNERLKKDGSKRTVTAFFWVPLPNRGVKPELLENKNYYRHIKNYVEWHSDEILKKIVHDFITCEDPVRESIFTKEFLRDMKREVLHFKRQGNPPICTHIIDDEANNLIIKSLLAEGLDNREDDKVKVVVYPCYLDGNDSLTNLEYYEAIAGTHFAIFPSYYEPWGYTPLEAAAMGVPSLTTDLAGFGRFIKPKLLPEHPGIFVLERYRKSDEEIVNSLADILYRFSQLDHSERVENKINAKQLSQLADWKHLIKNYIRAHNLALEK